MYKYFTDPKQIYKLEQVSGIYRGDIEKMHTALCGYGSNLLKFCSEIPKFKIFTSIIEKFMPEFQLMCFQNTELLPLLDLPHIRISRARMLFAAGFTDIISIARSKPSELVAKLKKINIKHARDIVRAAVLIKNEKLNTLAEQVDLLKEIGGMSAYF